MGGFISTSYALKYPQRVAHLVLADPWGMPQKPDQTQNLFPVPPSYKIKAVTTIGQYINPLAILRVAGPYGKIKCK
jgi:pimeloyl-ACP methyl ester carboxylesterase